MLDTDVAEVLVIENVAHLNPWNESAFVDCIAARAKGYACHLILHETRIVGYTVLSAVVGEAHLLNITVDPECQGQGLGRRLLRWVIVCSLNQSAQTLFLEVRSGNLAALTLYESAGFKRIGLRRDYYPSLLGREDAVVMGLDLAQITINESDEI
jgi:ribosomal-protein-alanine N-acetyltransferase